MLAPKAASDEPDYGPDPEPSLTPKAVQRVLEPQLGLERVLEPQRFSRQGPCSAPRTYYGLRSLPEGWLMAKFVDDVVFDLAAVYTLHEASGNLSCDCPSAKRPCKHITEVLPRLRPWANTTFYLNAESGAICNPVVGEAAYDEPDQGPEVGPKIEPKAEPRQSAPRSWRRF